MNKTNVNLIIWEELMVNKTNNHFWKEVMVNQKFHDNSTMWKKNISNHEMINDVYDNAPTKVITILICILVLTMGNILWFGIAKPKTSLSLDDRRRKPFRPTDL